MVPAIFTLSHPRKNKRAYEARQIVLEIRTNCTAPFGLSSSLLSKHPPINIPMHAPGIAIEPEKISKTWIVHSLKED